MHGQQNIKILKFVFWKEGQDTGYAADKSGP